MRVLVTGASGYVGRVVLQQLLHTGHEAIGLARRGKSGIDGMLWRRGNVLSTSSLRKATAEIDAVVHLSAVSGIRNAFEHPARYYRTNVGGSLNLLEVLAERPGDSLRLVFASTIGVYGAPPGQPITEDTSTDARNPYAASKLIAEQAIACQAGTSTLGAVTLRICNVAGGVGTHGDTNDSRLITRACAVASGRIPKLDVYGDGGAVRDFIHVADAARALVAAIDACEPGKHHALNIGATPASVADVISATRNVTGREIRVAHHPAHPGEVRELRVDAAKARKVLNWQPQCSDLDRLVADQWNAEQHLKNRR
jgi:UDP-glucose 4-epimerase